MVYLVDDDVDDLQIVQEALANNNYKGSVKTALNGQALLNDLHKSKGSARPDVIVLDLNMPLKNGFDVLEEMKRTPDLHNIPVIVLTASSNKNDETRCFELGCAFFFRKPYNLADYEPIVRTVKMFILN
jgi:CheY-like chemotaxis protein